MTVFLGGSGYSWVKKPLGGSDISAEIQKV